MWWIDGDSHGRGHGHGHDAVNTSHASMTTSADEILEMVALKMLMCDGSGELMDVIVDQVSVAPTLMSVKQGLATASKSATIRLAASTALAMTGSTWPAMEGVVRTWKNAR